MITYVEDNWVKLLSASLQRKATETATEIRVWKINYLPYEITSVITNACHNVS